MRVDSQRRIPIVLLLALLVLLVAPVCSSDVAADVPVAQEDVVQTEATTTTTTEPELPVDTVNNNNSNNNNNQEEPHCAWGTACHPDYVEEEGSERNTSHNNQNPTGTGNIPFVHHAHPNNGNIVAPPPEGFTITARVYTDPSDKLAHFTDDAEGSHITLPYWDCGPTGSTTSPLPVKHAYFRHALSGSKPQVWSGTEYGPHPQLVVALKRMEMTLNSGETKQLKAGDVVLLEDVVSGGHKLKALEGFDMTYMLLTLPQHYHHVGRDRMALKRTSTEKKQSPCTNENPAFVVGKQQQQSSQQSQQSSQQQSLPLSGKSWEGILLGDKEVVPFQDGNARRVLLGAVGLSLSTLLADWLGKVAPLWLAVGIGGTCFVVGGTCGIVQGGDYLWSELEMWQERKRLGQVPTEQEEEEEEEKLEAKVDKVINQ